MAQQVQNLVIVVNTASEKPYNQYAAYVVAFVAKKVAGVPRVTVFYGPQGVGMAKRGVLASFPIQETVKELLAGQIPGLNAADLPSDLEALARFEEEQLGVEIVSCGTFHVIDGFATSLSDRSGVVPFIRPLTVPEAVTLLLEADRLIYY